MQIFISYIKRLLLSPLFLSGNCHGRRYLLVWYAGGERTPRRDLCVRSHVGHQLLPKIDDAVCNDSVWKVYCRERNTKMANFILYRSSLSKHLSVYLVMQFVSSFLIVFLGILLCIGLFCIRGTLYCYDGNDYTGTFGVLLNEKDVGAVFVFPDVSFMPTVLLCGRFPVWQCLPAF